MLQKFSEKHSSTLSSSSSSCNFLLIDMYHNVGYLIKKSKYSCYVPNQMLPCHAKTFLTYISKYLASINAIISILLFIMMPWIIYIYIYNENLHYYFVCFLHYLRYKSATNFDHVIASIKCFPILQDQFILHKDLVDS